MAKDKKPKPKKPKAYLTFLGTNNYIPCTYYFGDREVAGVRFIQEATVQLFCDDWGPEDRILIFLTDEARKKNWIDGGHNDEAGNPCQGLETRLKGLSLPAQIKDVWIPDGRSEQEIWEIFEIIFKQLNSGDEVVFDITHAFRSIPMLAIVVLNYAKVMRDVSLAGIYYGAFEVIGNPEKARHLSLEKRRAPIFNLKQFDVLMDWTMAIDRFIKAGDATLAGELVKKHFVPMMGDGKNKLMWNINQLSSNLKAFTDILSTCRGKKITDVIQQLKESLLITTKLDMAPPFKPLLGKLHQQLDSFTGDLVQDGLRAARWCLEHNLIQQGFTLLMEFTFCYVIRAAGADATIEKNRKIAYAARAYVREKIPQDKWRDEAAENIELTEAMCLVIRQHPNLGTTIDRIQSYRNNINHAGFNNEFITPEKFRQKLGELIDQVEALLAYDRSIVNLGN